AAFTDLEEYFSDQGKLSETVNFEFEVKKPEAEVFEDTYSITAGDDPTDKDYLGLAWHVADATDALDSYGLKVLEEILLGNNQAPLKKALLDAEIGGDIFGGAVEVGFPTTFFVAAKYSDTQKMMKFNEVLIETLQSLVENGIDPELIEASLNKITFQTKEAAISEDNPRGVLYAITALSTWLYGEDPYV